MSATPRISGFEDISDIPTPNVEMPQSWVRISGNETRIHEIQLPRSGFIWQPFAELPANQQFGDIVRQQVHPRLVYRGCAEQTALFLETLGYRHICSGIEAIFELDNPTWNRPSLRALARRGMRHGTIHEFSGGQQLAAERTAALFARSRYAERPKLRYLFRLTPDETTRCFYFEHHSGQWLGAITISVKNPRFIATELLLRGAEAPVGVMEALIIFIAETLAHEGYDFWSIGEVPFYTTGTQLHHRLQALYGITGRLMKFAYNYHGLHVFKSKFSPHWRPVYICAKPDITLALLADMVIVSGFAQLAARAAAEVIRRTFSLDR